MFLFVFSVVAYQEYGIKKTLLIRFFIVRIAEVGISIFSQFSIFFLQFSISNLSFFQNNYLLPQ